MRPCFNLHCENGKEVEYLDDDTRVVTDEDCHICNGTGEVEDYCYCAATCKSECLCGWDQDNGCDAYLDLTDELEHLDWLESMDNEEEE